jgi:hypothetical protein
VIPEKWPCLLPLLLFFAQFKKKLPSSTRISFHADLLYEGRIREPDLSKANVFMRKLQAPATLEEVTQAVRSVYDATMQFADGMESLRTNRPRKYNRDVILAAFQLGPEVKDPLPHFSDVGIKR